MLRSWGGCDLFVILLLLLILLVVLLLDVLIVCVWGLGPCDSDLQWEIGGRRFFFRSGSEDVDGCWSRKARGKVLVLSFSFFLSCLCDLSFLLSRVLSLLSFSYDDDDDSDSDSWCRSGDFRVGSSAGLCSWLVWSGTLMVLVLSGISLSFVSEWWW